MHMYAAADVPACHPFLGARHEVLAAHLLAHWLQRSLLDPWAMFEKQAALLMLLLHTACWASAAAAAAHYAWLLLLCLSALSDDE
jgi:hypothetical protein